jgi:hypothetical protein
MGNREKPGDYRTVGAKPPWAIDKQNTGDDASGSPIDFEIEPSNAYESHFAKRPPQRSTIALTICAALIAERALAWERPWPHGRCD